MSYFWYILLVVIIYLIYKRLFSPIYESFKKGKKMISELSVDDRHSNIQDMLSKQLKVFEGLKDDPDGMTKELSNFKPFKKKKGKKKKKQTKSDELKISKNKKKFEEKILKLSDHYKKNKKDIDNVLENIPQMKELYKHINF